MAALYIGTSGFSYKQWKGAFYPPRLRQKDMLAYYASRLQTVEINNTFYRRPTEAAVIGWVSSVPDSFRFAVKAHRRLTHNRRPKVLETQLPIFADALAGFGYRLGPVLFQLPPTAAYLPGWLERVLSIVPSGWQVAFQFRHPTWHTDAVADAIERAGAAICHADGEPQPGPEGRGAFLYFRLRRELYLPAELSRWAERLSTYAVGGRDVYAYFKHEALAPTYAGWVQTYDRIGAQPAL